MRIGPEASLQEDDVVLRPYLPTWIKDERTEFALEMVSALVLTVAFIWWA
jgi:hypothetical protein